MTRTSTQTFRFSTKNTYSSHFAIASLFFLRLIMLHGKLFPHSGKNKMSFFLQKYHNWQILGEEEWFLLTENKRINKKNYLIIMN